MTRKNCPTCVGRKYVYLIGKTGFTIVDNGGRKVKCPHCDGTGKIESVANTETEKVIEKDIQDARTDEIPAVKRKGRPKKSQ